MLAGYIMVYNFIGSPSLKGKISSLKSRNSKKNKDEGFLQRLSLQGSRSIKDAMRDDPRYVTSGDVKRISQNNDEKQDKQQGKGFGVKLLFYQP